MAYTDFSRIQDAIQQAFETYWRVREGREERGERQKDRQQRMQELMMTLQSGRLTSQERNQAEKELERLRQQGAVNLEETKWNLPGAKEAREANVDLEKAMTGYYGRMPVVPGDKDLIDAQTQARLLWPKAQEEADELGKSLLSDMITLDYKGFSQKHVAMMNEEEFNKLKDGGFSAQNKWALNKAIEYVTPKYRPVFEGAKIGKDFDSYMAGFKATWNPDITDLVGGPNKPIQIPRGGGLHTPEAAGGAMELQEKVGGGIGDIYKRAVEGYRKWVEKYK